MTPKKHCPNCSIEFEPKSLKAIYCSHKCRNAAFHKARKERLSGHVPALTGPLSTPPSAISTETQIKEPVKTQELPVQLGPVSKFLIDRLQEENKDLKDELKKQKEKVDSLTEAKTELQKQVDDLTRKLEEKPSGLGAIVQGITASPENIKEVMMGCIELFREAKALSGKNDSPLVAWLSSQPEPIQKDFIEMVQAIAKDPNTIAERLATAKRSLMAPTELSGHQAAANHRVGAGYR